MPPSKMTLRQRLSGVQNDLNEFLGGVEDVKNCDPSYVMSCHVRIFSQLQTLVPDMISWLNSKASNRGETARKIGASYVSDYIAMLWSKSRVLRDWAVWSMNEGSITYLLMENGSKFPTVKSRVVIDFGTDTNRHFVTFFCACSGVLGVSKLRFRVRSNRFVDHVLSLLKSFQSPKVVAQNLSIVGGKERLVVGAWNDSVLVENQYPPFDSPAIKMELNDEDVTTSYGGLAASIEGRDDMKVMSEAAEPDDYADADSVADEDQSEEQFKSDASGAQLPFLVDCYDSLIPSKTEYVDDAPEYPLDMCSQSLTTESVASEQVRATIYSSVAVTVDLV